MWIQCLASCEKLVGKDHSEPCGQPVGGGDNKHYITDADGEVYMDILHKR
jgi:hypothetical protein